MPVVLDRLDTPPIEYDDLSPELERWFTVVTDNINYNIQLIEDELASIDARLTAGGL